MKINENIPGWNDIHILNVLAKCASDVPENGNILEIGALFGRSTYALGHNKRDSVKLTTIDIWTQIDLQYHKDVYFHDRKSSGYELSLLESKLINGGLSEESTEWLWKEYTKGIVNNIGVKNKSSMPNEDFPMMDLIFHDAEHNYEDVYFDLNHWLPKLKDDGILIVDDYDMVNFPGVCKAVDQVVAENNLKTEMVTHRNILLKR